MSSCFGLGRKRGAADREPLLPQYADDTERQRQLHQKLHSYQMLRALSHGYMPSTEQIIIHLRSILASDVLERENPELSDNGRRLVALTRQWLLQFVDLLQHKNEGDQVQDLIWCLANSRISVDTEHLAHTARRSVAKADAAAAYQSVSTVGSLLLTNSDFRIFLNDVGVVAREVLRDSAFTLSSAAEQAGTKLEPSEADKQAVGKPGADGDAAQAPTGQELRQEVTDVSKVVANGSAQVAQTAVESAEDKLSGDEGRTLRNRLKQAILKLRQRDDYSDSVSTLSLLIQRYAFVYSRAAEEIQGVAEEDTHQNAELDRAVRNAWTLLTSFGDKREWDQVEQRWHVVMQHRESDPHFEESMRDAGNSLQKMLTDPSFFDNADKFQELRSPASQKSGEESKLNEDINAFLKQLEIAFRSILQDEDIHKLLTTSTRLFELVSPLDRKTNPDLIQDSINVFVPVLIAAVQHIPIPRLEVSTPDIDLLLENLIIEPGRTVNTTSFLPYRLKVETYNDFELRKAMLRTTSHTTSLLTIKLDGISARADDIGFWLRAHSGLFRLADEGITSFALDERGIDIHMDVEICRDRLEQIVTLNAVRVQIHKLSYQLRKSKFSWLGWLFKPILRPLIRKTMERQLATAVADFFHAANRELLFARERLRATRISNPDDLLTFFKAVTARLTPADQPDLYTRVGVAPPESGRVRKNVFQGVYAPGSVVKLWHEEALRARDRVEDFESQGWRNGIFDIHVQPAA